MNTPVNPHISATAAPPVMEARRWIEGVTYAPDRPLLNLSQAAPMQPPPPALLTAMAETVLSDTAAHLYGRYWDCLICAPRSPDSGRAPTAETYPTIK